MRFRISLLFLVATWVAEAPSALTHSRSYQWSFGAGNLAANWSFENPLEFWTEIPLSGVIVDSRFKAQGGPAKSGSFVAKVEGTHTGASGYQALRSVPFPIPPGVLYTLSLYYKASGLSGQVRPAVMVTNTNGSYTLLSGTDFSSASDWKLSVFPFAAPSNAQSLRIIVAEFLSGGAGTFYFDEVVLEEGWLDSNQVKENRQRNAESIVFGDALGRTHQTQMKIAGSPDKYLVGGSGFDDFARPESSYLPTPFSISTPAFQNNLLAGAQGFYNGSGPFNAKGYPFSRVKYADELGGRVLESSSPDSAWQFGKGHTAKQDFYFVNDTLVPSNIENPGTNNAECRYRLDWAKSPDSSFSLTWTNKLGQVVRTAQNLIRSSSGANTWKWSTTRQEYYPAGPVKKVRTPLDDSAGSEAFAEVSQFNAQGQIISAYSPDRNLRKVWYNRFGQIRYSQDSVQRPDNKYTYFEYDDQGRLVSQGTQITTSLPQDSVDMETYSQGTKTEEIGFIYEDSSSFYARTGFTLQEIVGSWKGYLDPKYTRTRLFCKYHRNQGTTTPNFTAKDKFVADFFSYDSHGNVTISLKFIGPIRDPLKRLQDVWYSYDSQDRLTTYIHYASATEYAYSNSESYSYDGQGRVSAITGINGKPLARYVYNDWGPLDEVELGGLSSGDSATAIGYGYNSQGAVKEIWATGSYDMGGSTRQIFQQFLGYESKAYGASGVPAPIQGRFDGTITQQVYKYTSDMDSVKPVRASNYVYDQIGRMSLAQAYWNTNASPLIGSSQAINDANLTMDTTSSLSSRFEYDLNGRISGQRSAGASASDSAKYFYKSNSYRLDRVTGKLASGSTRDMSGSGSFDYDGNGALVQDKSKKLRIAYGWDGLPMSFTIDSVAPMGTLRCCTYDAKRMPMHFKVRLPSLAQHNYYDADGNRVSRVEVESKPALRTQSVHYVYMASGMLKEWSEEYHLSGRVKKASATVSLFGRGLPIGRIRPDGKYEFFIKSYNGSTMVTVDDRGRYAGQDYSTGRAYDYTAYGSHKLLKVGSDSTDVTQKFTGKEFEKLTGLYAFGGRWMDSELGLFVSADPLGQFFNPYSYGMGDPINGADPNGLWWNPFDVDDWESLGKSANDVLEKSWNKAFNDNCNYESNESCRDRWSKKLYVADAVGQLMHSCGSGYGDKLACSTLREIGYDSEGSGFSPQGDAIRRLAKLIIEDGGHKVGINLSVGGGKAVPAVQYDDVTIPLGVINTSGSGFSSEDRNQRSVAIRDSRLANESRPGYNVVAGGGPRDEDYPLEAPFQSYRCYLPVCEPGLESLVHPFPFASEIKSTLRSGGFTFFGTWAKGKRDLKQINDIAREVGVDRNRFGDYIHEIKAQRGMRPNDNFSYEQLRQLAKEMEKGY